MTQDSQQTQTTQTNNNELVGSMEQKGPVEVLDEVMEEADLLTDAEKQIALKEFMDVVSVPEDTKPILDTIIDENQKV